MDYDCDVHSACDNGTCVRYFSLQNTNVTHVGTYPEGLSMTCDHGYAVYNTKINAFKCFTPILTNRTTLISCRPGSQCRNPASNQRKECVCGFNEEGAAYCPYFESDSPL
jgi:hypothetical protein